MKRCGHVLHFAGRVLPGLVSAVLLCVVPVPALAQGTSGAILGAVKDQDGAAIPGANIVVRNVLTNSLRSMSTDSAGRFRVEELPLGEYEVQAEHDKFKKMAHSGIVLTLGRDAVGIHAALDKQIPNRVGVFGSIQSMQSRMSGIGSRCRLAVDRIFQRSGTVGAKKMRQKSCDGGSRQQLRRHAEQKGRREAGLFRFGC